jgi:acetyltransferase-like isoleucine patch superfamily enzyme
MPFVYNPWRRHSRSRRQRLIATVLLPITKLGLACGFPNMDYSYVHGERQRLHLGRRVSTMNTLFNVMSGEIYLGDDTILSHNCQLLTGTHLFHHGRRASLQDDSAIPEVPRAGRDIQLGTGCFVGAGAIILGGVAIGDHVIVAAGAVVTHDLPSYSFAAGVPARVIRVTSDPASESAAAPADAGNMN